MSKQVYELNLSFHRYNNQQHRGIMKILQALYYKRCPSTHTVCQPACSMHHIHYWVNYKEYIIQNVPFLLQNGYLYILSFSLKLKPL